MFKFGHSVCINKSAGSLMIHKRQARTRWQTQRQRIIPCFLTTILSTIQPPILHVLQKKSGSAITFLFKPMESTLPYRRRLAHLVGRDYEVVQQVQVYGKIYYRMKQHKILPKNVLSRMCPYVELHFLVSMDNFSIHQKRSNVP